MKYYQQISLLIVSFCIVSIMHIHTYLKGKLLSVQVGIYCKIQSLSNLQQRTYYRYIGKHTYGELR